MACVAVFSQCVSGGSFDSVDTSGSDSADADTSVSSGVAETWSGTLKGSALGAFVCFFGNDSYYDESGNLTLNVPSPGLAGILSNTSTVSFTGTYSNSELGIESDGGIGCKAAPTVSSQEVASTNVSVKAGFTGKVIQFTAPSVLMRAQFMYSKVDSLNSKFFSMTATSITETKISGTWRAFEGDNTTNVSAVIANGTFVLDRTSSAADLDPAVVKVVLSADKLLGFLPAGSTAQLSVKAFDSSNNELACAPSYHFANPVNNTINVIASISSTGILTMGNKQGAARVWADCDGVQSNQKLVSGTGL